MEQAFGRLTEEKRRMDDDYKSRVEGNIRFIQTLRADVDEQRNIQNERKKQNADLNSEIDKQRVAISDRNVEIERLRHDLQLHEDTNSNLQNQK